MKKLIVILTASILLFTIFSAASGIKIESTNNTEIENMGCITVEIVSPKNGGTVHGYSVPVRVDVEAEHGIDIIEIYFDGELIVTKHTSPMVIFLDTTEISDGRHEINAIAYDTQGSSGSDSIWFNVDNFRSRHLFQNIHLFFRLYKLLSNWKVLL